MISKPDSNKARGDDMISIRTLKLCDKSICKPLIIIFKSDARHFPIRMEKSKCRSDSQNTTNSVLKTTDLSLFSQFAAKFSSVLFVTPCSHILKKTT